MACDAKRYTSLLQELINAGRHKLRQKENGQKIDTSPPKKPGKIGRIVEGYCNGPRNER